SARRSRVAGTLVACSLVGAVVVDAVAARHAAPSDVSPVTPAGAWNDASVVAIVAGFALYVLGTRLAWSGALRLRVAVAVAVVVQALPLAAPLLLSKDAFLYWGEGRVLV